MMDLQTWVRWSLRKASYRWPPRNAALRAAAVTVGKNSAILKKFPRCRNFYTCAGCKEVLPRKGVSIDHIDPVVDPKKGWQGFDQYINRMFCNAAGFQILCKVCHDAKTKTESGVRAKTRRRK